MKPRSLPLLLVLILLNSIATVIAIGQDFLPTAPELDDEWDWVKLDSGEWLKGELRVMYDDEVEFDSDHFGVITIDWDDIEEVYSAGNKRIQVGRQATVRGKVKMQEDAVQLSDSDKTFTIDRNEIISIATGAPREIDNWSFKLTFGANVRTGNVEQTEYSARSYIQRRTATNRFYWDYQGTISETGGEQITNNHRSNSYYDRFFSQRLFWRTVSVEYYRDIFQNIASRYTLNTSIGYTVVDTKDLTIDVTGGPAWQHIKYYEVAAGEEDEETGFGGILTTVVDWDITDRIEFLGTYRVQFTPRETGGIISHADSTFEIELTDKIDLDLSFIWDRIEYPAQREDGTFPEQNDFQFIVSLGLDI